MCAINPKHQKHFTLSVYTSEAITEDEFTSLVYEVAAQVEIALNDNTRLRWHVKETES